MRRLLATAFLVCAATTAQAALITSLPSGGTTTVFTATGIGDVFHPSTVVVDGFGLTGDPHAYFGDINYGFDENGQWADTAPFTWVGLNTSVGSMTFDLGGAYGSVGAFINYSLTGGAPHAGTPTITALDASLMVLESYDIFVDAPISTPGGLDDGGFRGISTGVNNIAYLRLSGSFIAAHSITVAAVDAPEPATLAVFGIGLAGLGLLRRRFG